MRRLFAAAALMLVAGCSDSPTEPDRIVGRPCSPGESGCHEIVEILAGRHVFALYTFLDDGSRLECSVNEATVYDPRVTFGAYWRCDWKPSPIT